MEYYLHLRGRKQYPERFLNKNRFLGTGRSAGLISALKLMGNVEKWDVETLGVSQEVGWEEQNRTFSETESKQRDETYSE